MVYSPPFRDPYNYNLDPAMLLGIQALGTAMPTRLAIENKPGATMRSGASYDGWRNGGIRNTATFHNTIAVLTEMIGSPTPTRIPPVKERQIPTGFTGPLENVTDWNVPVPAGTVAAASGAKEFVTSPATNDSYIALNRLLKAGQQVMRIPDSTIVNGKHFAPGALHVTAGRNTARTLQQLSRGLGLNFEGVRTGAPGNSTPLQPVRIGLWDNYGGSMTSGQRSGYPCKTIS